MKSPETYMDRCFQLAASGLGNVAPNPLVGCVIVSDNKVIGEGYHQAYGRAHAEVNAIESVKDQELLKGATLYVNLEPCVHFGKTPPCCDRIIAAGIQKVVYAATDPNVKVGGRGARALRQAGVEVVDGIGEEAEYYLNRRFRTFHQKKRPYIILKWATSSDNFMDAERRSGEKGSKRISNEASRDLLHLWRSQEQAILIGTNTAVNDNPALTVRNGSGKNPLRLVMDRNLRIPESWKLFSDGEPTVIYTSQQKKSTDHLTFVQLDFNNDVIASILADLYDREIQSVIVEGGAQLLNSFIEVGMWDEVRVFVSPQKLHAGLPSPALPEGQQEVNKSGDNLYVNIRRS